MRGPSGSTITGVAPSNIYPTSDGKHVIIGANGESLYRRLVAAMGQDNGSEGGLLDPERFGSNPLRWQHREELDAAIADWTRQRPSEEVQATLQRAGVPVGGIYDAADMAADPHFRARGMIQEGVPGQGEDAASAYTLPGMCPSLQRSPGRTIWAGPELGSSTAQVLRDVAGYTQPEIDDLMRQGAVRGPA